MAPKIDATECFDSHLSIEIQKASGAASKGQPWKGFRNQEDTRRGDDDEETRRKSSSSHGGKQRDRAGAGEALSRGRGACIDCRAEPQVAARSRERGCE